VVVPGVDVAPGGVGLPDLDERVADRPSVRVDNSPAQDDALAQGLAGVLPGEVGVLRPDGYPAEGGPGCAVEPVLGQPDRLA
jgi:hypothetical protein